MTYVYLGIVLFFGSHLYSMLLPASRDRLKARLGENAFKGLFALASIAGIGLLVYGYSQAWATGEGTEQVYDAPAWGRHLAMLLVLVGFILIAASHGKGYLRAFLRNPMSIGVGLWALGHLLANGMKIDLWLFWPFLLLAALDIILCTVRGKRPEFEPRLRSDIVAVIAGMVLYVVFLLLFHPYVLGVPVV
jgi:uncharacterized membrane protein